MPSRRRPKQPTTGAGVTRTAEQTDLERFAASVRATEAAKVAKAEQERRRVEQQRAAAVAAQEHEAALRGARADHARAVEQVKAARRNGRGAAEADAAWKAAKARLIELETGVAPAWAPKPDPAAEPTDEPPSDAPSEDAAVDADVDAAS